MTGSASSERYKVQFLALAKERQLARLRRMNISALVNAIIRQTTVLVAELATAGGGRVHLAHVGNQIFLDLVAALKGQGLGSKVIADMFGLALRTYHEKVRRLSESQTMRGRSLWEAVLEYVEGQDGVLRAQVLAHFHQDDPASVRGVLRDLVHSALLYRSGRKDGTTYRAASEQELRATAAASEESFQRMVWISVQRLRPATVADLCHSLSVTESSVDKALTELQHRGLVVALNDGNGLRYDSLGCLLSYDDAIGWEAAVYDHFHALVKALCTKVGGGQRRALPEDWVGGSTFGFELWKSHPHFEEATNFLRTLREQGTELREKVARYNEHHDPLPSETRFQVVTYIGQVVTEDVATVATAAGMEKRA